LRFKFDKTKSRRLRTMRGIGFEEVQELFYTPYFLDQLDGEPEQWVAIGWVNARLYTVVYEERPTRWATTTIWSPSGERPPPKGRSMKKASRRRPSAEQIARSAERGEDVTRYFAGKGRMMPPLQRPDVQRVNVDFTVEMLRELDAEARRLNISRQAVIKTMLSRTLDERRDGRKKAS